MIRYATMVRPMDPHNDEGEWRRRKRGGTEGDRKKATTTILATDIYRALTRCQKLC